MQLSENKLDGSEHKNCFKLKQETLLVLFLVWAHSGQLSATIDC
jgi:hypothetical protein